jgi:hypothetical protein
MYRLVAKETARKIDFWRNGVRMRMPGVLLADGSFIKLLPNRPVDISDASMDMNKALLESPYVSCRRLSVDNPTNLTPIEEVKESVLVIEEVIPKELVVTDEDIVSDESPNPVVLLEDVSVIVDHAEQESSDDFISPSSDDTPAQPKRRRRK